jgi:tetratricopeptide (TPR) repeat protein
MTTETPGSPFEEPAQSAPLEHRQPGAADLEGKSEAVGMLANEFHVLQVCPGGMGRVYLCELAGQNGPRHAWKTFKKQLFFDRARQKAFVREIAVWMRLSGLPHIMPALDLRYFDGRPFVLMPAVEPGPDGAVSVADVVSRGPVPADQALRLAYQAVNGMMYAQEQIPGLVHGDLKPDNLLLLGGNVHVSDFGLARVVAETDPGAGLQSSWAYQAPERWEGQTGSPASDIYAFGVLLFELLTGKRPFWAFRQEEWARAHRSTSPQIPQDLRSDALAVGLMDLALRCLHKIPQNRPQEFKSLYQELAELSRNHDILGTLVLQVNSLQLRDAYRELQARIRPSLIKTLLTVGETELALAEAEATLPEAYDAKLWMMRGRALAFNGRDEEALSCFEKALHDELARDDRHMCQMEFALSLKALRRFDEAISLFRPLLSEVSASLLPAVVNNLASLYLAKNQPDQVVRLLVPFLSRHRDVAEAWGCLAGAYHVRREYDQAVRSFQTALSLAPNKASYRVRLASVWMETGALNDAVVSLELAHQQGLETADLYERLLVCHLAQRRFVEASAVLNQSQSLLPPQAVASVRQAVTQSTAEAADAAIAALGYAEARASGTPPPRSEIQIPATMELPPAADEVAAAPQPSQAKVTLERSGVIVSRQLERAVGLPHVHTRDYPADGTFSIDFYHHLEAEDYANLFQQAWRMLERRMSVMGGYSPRAIPFFFTRCSGCGFHIMTNRDEGQNLRCKLCGTEDDTARVERLDLQQLLGWIYEAIGKCVTSLRGQVAVLLVQPSDEDSAGLVDELCREAGFVPANQGVIAVQYLIAQGAERRSFDPRRLFSVWAKECTSPVAYEGEPPPEVDRLVRQLRREVEGIRSIDLCYDPGDPAFGRTSQEQVAALAEAARIDPQNAAALIAQANLLLQIGRHQEARQKARAATLLHSEEPAAWMSLGMIEAKRGEFDEAIRALEECLQLDPLYRNCSYLLLHCYSQVGKTAEAEELAARLRSLGGWL